MHTHRYKTIRGTPYPPVRGRSTALLRAEDPQQLLQATPHQSPACAPAPEAPPQWSLSPTPADGQLVSATLQLNKRRGPVISAKIRCVVRQLTHLSEPLILNGCRGHRNNSQSCHPQGRRNDARALPQGRVSITIASNRFPMTSGNCRCNSRLVRCTRQQDPCTTEKC